MALSVVPGLQSVLDAKAPVVSPVFNGGAFTIRDIGRTGQNDNAPTLNLDVSEGVGYPEYVTHYGVYGRFHQTAKGTGDRIGAGFYQVCDATLPGKSCVGSALSAVAGGKARGGYVAGNSVVKLPADLQGPASATVAHEFNTQTHSPVKIRNAIRITDEAMMKAPVTKGSLEDAAIAIATSNLHGVEGLGYRIGLQFGENPQGYPNNWPILPGGTLIQADNPNVRLDYGIDLKGSTSGFNGAAVALPIHSPNNNIAWGNNKQGGSIGSTATGQAPIVTFTDNGLFVNNTKGELMAGILNDGKMQAPLSTPRSSSAPCEVGQFSNDAEFHYVCVAENHWKRVALSDF
jgi:hypothetical protein